MNRAIAVSTGCSIAASDGAYPSAGQSDVDVDGRCQYCRTPLHVTWVDLGRQPLSNDYRASMAAARNAEAYPLHARFCEDCGLVQVDRVVPPSRIFSDYAYFSSQSASWLTHCESYARMVVDRFGLGPDSRVVEIASNDGYLLQFFRRAGVRILGIDPAANVAGTAIAAGIPTEVMFFGADTAAALVARGFAADHLTAKNVLAHVPDIADFARGVAIMLKPNAVFTVEFPHLLATMSGIQFDQIYHEHFCYLSLMAVSRILCDQGLRVFDVEQLDTHGGSLRVFACHHDAAHEEQPSVQAIMAQERAARLDHASAYSGFDARVRTVRAEFQALLNECAASGSSIVGYGAAAKGNTFLNYCDASPATLPFIADKSPAKVGRFMPGSGIAIRDIAAIAQARPDYVLILPWNLSGEISDQLSFIRDWGGRFVTAIPALRVF